uniref:N-acetyltransferase domain-containing protein n=1 Tax=Plectus sambesii TaxID=2011161 RepID=A0A914W006_9BILA
MSRAASARIVRQPTADQLHQFATLLIADRAANDVIMNDRRPASIVQAVQLPWCHFVLIAPNDAPALIVGGIVFVDLPHSSLCYLGALFVRKDFRGQGFGMRLFREFQLRADQRRVWFCDLARISKIRLRHSSFSVEGRYRILRLSGYAENIAIAAGRLLAAHEHADDQEPLPEVCAFPGSLDLSAIVQYDSLVSGRNRSAAFEELTKVDGFRGLAAIDDRGAVLGFGVSLHSTPTSGEENSNELRIGPLYAVNLITAVCLLRDLCATADDQVVMHVPDLAKRMLRFLGDKAACEVDTTFQRYFSRE